MIKPPYTKWINDIKTKLGFNRTMTASGVDVVDAVNKQALQITNLQNNKQDVLNNLSETIQTYVGSGSIICRRYGNTVSLSIAITTPGTGTLSIATLPVNYRPSTDISVALTSTTKPIATSILANGQITAYGADGTDIFSLITYII